MKIPKIKTRKIKQKLERVPRVLGEKAFFTFLVLFFLALGFGFLIFYKYNFVVKKTSSQITKKPPQLKEQVYQDVLKVWQEKKKQSQETDSKIYPNPFSVD